jgi:hypothetical protein
LFAHFNTLDFAIWARDNVVAVKLDLTDDESDLERSSSLKKALECRIAYNLLC